MFTISCPPKVIWLGRKGENEFRTIEVEVSEWLRDYPNGTISVVYHRPDGAIYLPTVTTSGNVTSWLITATDTAIAGKGEVEYRIIDGDIIGKSVKMPTMVSAAINATTDAPAPPPEDWTAVAAEIIGMIGDLANLDTEAKNNLVAAINEAFNSGGGGGTSDHRQLTHRNDADQHPMSAITGLVTALDGKADAADIPSLAGYATEEWVEGKGYLTQHQSLAGYATESYVQNYHDNTKQDVITDLSTIRSGAALGATALQSVPNTYRTAAQQDIIDNGKQDKLIAGENITISADGKTISATGGGAEAFIVNITESGGTYTADKTNAEIYAAWTADKAIWAIAGASRLQIVSATATNAVFACVVTVGNAKTNVSIVINNDVVTAASTELQSATITDTAGYYTTDTVEGALAEIGAELSGINTLVGSGVIV